MSDDYDHDYRRVTNEAIIAQIEYARDEIRELRHELSEMREEARERQRWVKNEINGVGSLIGTVVIATSVVLVVQWILRGLFG